MCGFQTQFLTLQQQTILLAQPSSSPSSDFICLPGGGEGGMCHNVHVWVRGQLDGVCSLLPSDEAQGSNSGLQTGKQLFLPAEPLGYLP